MRRLVVLVAVVAASAACSSGGPVRVGTQPSWREKPVATTVKPQAVTFAPTSAPAARYNEGLVAPPSTALGDAVTAAVRDAALRAGTAVPTPDARLFRACEELAAVVPEEGVIGYGLVEFALQRQGIVEPSPHLLVVWGDLDPPSVIVEQLQPRLAEILGDGATARLGVGAARRRADGTGAVVFALQASSVATAPIPRTAPPDGRFAIDATVDGRYREPEVFVTHEDGKTERLPLRVGGHGGFSAEVACGGRQGKQQIEITASDKAGSTVLANFPVWCGAAPPASMTSEPASDDAPVADAGDAERRLLALVNRDRLAAGLPALVWDDGLAAVARGHSLEMRTTKVVAHISPTTGSAADRVRAAGIKTAVVLENVARAYGVGEAHAGLMNSPGHRANVMSTLATRIGVGIVLGDDVSGRREVFVTQVFTRVPPRIDPATTAETVRQRLSAVRPLATNPILESAAQGLADALARGQTRDQAWPAVKQRVDGLGASFRRVGSVVTAVSELDGVDGRALIGDYQPDEVGVGIAQGNHPEIGEGAIWIVVLMGERRAP